MGTLVVLENETAKRDEFTFGYNLTELRILISESGQIEVRPEASNPSVTTT
jgi:hypothetical protein